MLNAELRNHGGVYAHVRSLLAEMVDPVLELSKQDHPSRRELKQHSVSSTQPIFLPALNLKTKRLRNFRNAHLKSHDRPIGRGKPIVVDLYRVRHCTTVRSKAVTWNL